MSEREQRLEKNIQTLLKMTAEFQRPCKACGRGLWFVRLRNKTLMPFTEEGLSHYADCPHADEFRKARATA